METKLKDPVRNINPEYLQGLEVLSNKEFPLPGSKCKGGSVDIRHKHLSGAAEVVLFDHLATVRHKSSSMVFVAFRKTMDALHLEQNDPTKYPSWLMDSSVKKTELDVYIHALKSPYNTNPGLVLKDAAIVDASAQTRVDKWLAPIITPWVFDTVAYFLLKNNVITEEMYGKIQ